MSIRKEELQIGSDKVIIDPENLRFNETTLNQYIMSEGGFYDNYGAYLARAEKILQSREMELEEIFASTFALHKDGGGSDKLAEARAKSDEDYTNKKRQVVEAKYLVSRLKNHLKAWDKNHDNAQSLGHMLRKEMDKLNADIRTGLNGTYGNHSSEYSQYDEVDKIVKSFGDDITADVESDS